MVHRDRLHCHWENEKERESFSENVTLDRHNWKIHSRFIVDNYQAQWCLFTVFFANGCINYPGIPINTNFPMASSTCFVRFSKNAFRLFRSKCFGDSSLLENSERFGRESVFHQQSCKAGAWILESKAFAKKFWLTTLWKQMVGENGKRFREPSVDWILACFFWLTVVIERDCLLDSV